MESISGKAPLAKYWLHTGFLTLPSDEKMSKSLRQLLHDPRDARARRRADLRFYLLSRHYRERWRYSRDCSTPPRGAEAHRELLVRLPETSPTRTRPRSRPRASGSSPPSTTTSTPPPRSRCSTSSSREQHRRGEVPGSCAYALINDLNDLFEAFDRGDDRTTADEAAVEAALSRRCELRAARRFAEADAIRDELHAQGIVIEDANCGTRWRVHETVTHRGGSPVISQGPLLL